MKKDILQENVQIAIMIVKEKESIEADQEVWK